MIAPLKLSDDGLAIVINGGQVLGHDESVENIDRWSLRLEDLRWIRLTDRQWPRLKVYREDGRSLHLWQYTLHLWQYSTLAFELEYKEYRKFRGADRVVEAELACIVKRIG